MCKITRKGNCYINNNIKNESKKLQMQIYVHFEGKKRALSKQWRYTFKGVQKGQRGAANSEQCKIYGLNCSLIDSGCTNSTNSKLISDLYWYFVSFIFGTTLYHNWCFNWFGIE